MTAIRVVGEDPVDLPLNGSSADQVALFDRGDALFDAVFRVPDGLGPLYIRTACSACHNEAGRGPGLVEKMSPADAAAAPVMLPYGSTIRPFAVAGASMPLVPPEGGWGHALQRSVRVGPALWGRGYVEAITDAEIERVAHEQSLRSDAIRGRINRVTYHSMGTTDPQFAAHAIGETGLIGRFGLKARIATVDDFSADALQGDMGITSPLRPAELANPEGVTDDVKMGVDVELQIVADLASYVRMIEIPDRDPNAATPGARAVFEQTLCGACHVPALRTRADYPVALLADIDAPVYSDLLLHDMGDALADGVPDENATGREWRTTPLIGLRFFRSYLHDGRAHSIDEAIRLHAGVGSQANEAVARYEALTDAQRADLLRFVTSL
ncbi:MAG: di-heme oxidoredictase family protein [Bacteroidota bacterium]